MASVAAAVVMALFVAGGGTVYASQDSLPGDRLYTVKTGAESFRISLAGDASAARLWLESSEKRLAEAEALNQLGRTGGIETAMAGYIQAVTGSMEGLEAITSDDELAEELSKMLSESLSGHAHILDDLEDRVPPHAYQSIIQARQSALNGLGGALQALSRQNPEEAMQINLDAMEGRLNRMKAQAEAGKPVDGEGSLAQFEALQAVAGETIQAAADSGRDATNVQAMLAGATSKHLEVLTEVYGSVPEQAKGAVEAAMENSLNGHQKAVEALEKAGAPDKIPAEIPAQAGMPDRIKQKLEEMTPPKPDTPAGGPPQDAPGDGAPHDVAPGGPDHDRPDAGPPADIPGSPSGDNNQYGPVQDAPGGPVQDTPGEGSPVEEAPGGPPHDPPSGGQAPDAAPGGPPQGVPAGGS